jgi:hypothetical protein
MFTRDNKTKTTVLRGLQKRFVDTTNVLGVTLMEGKRFDTPVALPQRFAAAPAST